MLYLGSPSLCSFPRPRSSGPASPRLIFDLKAVTWVRKDRSLHLLGSSVPAAKRRSGLDLNPPSLAFFPTRSIVLYKYLVLFFLVRFATWRGFISGLQDMEEQHSLPRARVHSYNYNYNTE
ncbi:hypothetical protein V8C44DRAFT_340836 [Trichoderma aethiopicum]